MTAMRTSTRWASGIQEGGPPSELNLTPMIDIVFQLLVFFLLTLNFKSVDRRIESMLPKSSSFG